MFPGRTIIATLCVVTVGVAAIALARGGHDYRVTILFENASQLVKGDEVETGGVPIGTVESIGLTRDRAARVIVRITDADRRPLREGTKAVVRQMSLAGVANRYVDLLLPGGAPPPIPDGGTIPGASTTSAVDLDQLFDTFDPKTRHAFGAMIRGQGRMLDGAGPAIDTGLLYLNPAVAASTRLLAAIDGDRDAFDRFLTASAGAATDVASQRDALGGFVGHLATALAAVDRHRGSLADALQRLPHVLRTSTATLATLRGTIDELRPLAVAAGPAARRLAPFTDELAQFTRSARPVLGALAPVLGAAGRDNDLVDVLHRMPGLDAAATRAVRSNGKARPSAFATLGAALRGLTPEIAFARPYSADATGWFDDFAHSGVYDALGGTGRIAFHSLAYANVDGHLTYVPPDLRAAVFDRVAQRNQRDHCPGSMERGAAWKPTPSFHCDLSQVPPGP